MRDFVKKNASKQNRHQYQPAALLASERSAESAPSVLLRQFTIRQPVPALPEAISRNALQLEKIQAIQKSQFALNQSHKFNISTAPVMQREELDHAGNQNTKEGQENAAEQLLFGRVSKQEFLSALMHATTETADAVLAAVNQSSDNCPYIKYWFSLCADASPEKVEKYLIRYAPGVQNAGSLEESIAVVVDRVRKGLEANIQSGSLEGVPDEVPKDLETSQAPAAAQADVAQLCGSETDVASPQVQPSVRATALGFTLANLIYASGKGGNIGSIYFTTGRIRLAHDHGPSIGHHPGVTRYTVARSQYRPPNGTGARAFNNGSPLTDIIGLTSYRIAVANQGEVLVESFDGATIGHISRGGPVTAPAITQQDINTMIQMIEAGTTSTAIKAAFRSIPMN